MSGATVTFSTTLGSLSATSVTTNANGIAQVILNGVATLGIASVQVSTGGYSDTVEVAFVEGAPAIISLSANPTSVSAGGTSTIVATVLDSNSLPVNGTGVVFDIPTNLSGGSLSAISGTTSANGQVTITYTAGNTTSVTDQVRVRAQANSALDATTAISIGASSVSITGITVSAGTSSIVANASNSVAITAEVAGAGAGATVTFATTLGTLSSATAVTDASGKAQVTLQGVATVGTATITASVSGFSASTSVNFVAGVPTALTVATLPSTVSPGGKSVITVTATDGTFPVKDQIVQFSLSTNNTGASLDAVSATTDINGQARVNYTAGNMAGVDTVRAVMAVDTSVGNTSTITVSANPVKAVVITLGTVESVADGVTQLTVRARVVDVNDQGVANVSVAFATTAGTLISATALTQSDGYATTTLTAPTKTGTAVITASYQGFFGSESVEFKAGPVSQILQYVTPSTVVTGGEFAIAAAAMDANDNRLSDERLTFLLRKESVPGSGTFDVIVDSMEQVTDATGVVRISFTAAAAYGVSSGDNLQLSTSSVNGTNTTSLILVDNSTVRIGGLTLSTVNTSITADGASRTLLRASVQDTGGAAIEGTPIAFATSLGTLQDSAGAALGATVNTDSSGVAEAYLMSATKPGVAVVTVSSGGVTDAVQVAFVAGSVDGANSAISISPSAIPADGASTAIVTVALADANGNPVANGTSVLLYTTLGAVISDNPAETISGRATFTIQAPASSGVATVSLYDYPDVASATLGFGSVGTGTPANILISSISSNSISVAGVGQVENASITVQVVDNSNTAVPNTAYDNMRVSFLAQPNGGEYLSAGTDTTSGDGKIELMTNDGYATFNLQAGTLPGIVELLVEVLDASGTPLSPAVKALIPQLSIASGPAHTIALTLPHTNAIVNLGAGPDEGLQKTPGFYSRKGGLIVTDRYGNAVADGTRISLGVLDSVISSGTASGATTAASANFVDATASFNTDTVTRNGVTRFIQANDRVVAFSAESQDKNRHVQTAPNTPGTVVVNKAYNNAAAGLDYAIGSSLLGAAIYGIDETRAATEGTVATMNGLAELRLVYPANTNTIFVGCGDASSGFPPGDSRHAPLGSARVITVAAASDDSATMVSEGNLCFSAIAEWTLTAVPTSISSTTDVTLEVVDGGDEIPLPFVTVTPYVNVTKGAVLVTATPCTTPADSGTCVSTITVTGGASGDTADVTYYVGDAPEVTVSVKIP